MKLWDKPSSITSQPAADVARAGTEKWHSKLLLRKMQGLPDLGFLGALSVENRRQEVKPRSTERSQKDHKELPGIERSLHSIFLWMVRCKKQKQQKPQEGVFVKFSQFRWWRLTVLFLPRKKYVEGCNGRTLRLSARHSLWHVGPVGVSMYQICWQLYLFPLTKVFGPVMFSQFWPCSKSTWYNKHTRSSVFDINRHNAH